MEKLKEKLTVKTIIIAIIIIAIGVVSFTTMASHYSEPETYTKSIESLEQKEKDVLKMSVITAGISTGLSALPNDTASPLADSFADLTSTLLVILSAIMLEKYLLTLMGLISFKILIPIACAMGIVAIWHKRDVLLPYAIRLLALAICFVVLIPVSTWTTSFIEKTYETSIELNLEEAKATADMLEDTKTEDNDDGKFFNKAKKKIQQTFVKAETVLSNLIETAAFLIVTSCIIPIGTLLLFIWLINVILGVSVPTVGIFKLMKTGHKVRRKAIVKESKSIDVDDYLKLE